MSKTDHAEVLVVGAGPVGMLTALLLGQAGVRVKLIDQESRPAGHSYACALHPASLRILDQAGLAADIVNLGHRVDRVALFDGRSRRAELRLSELGGDFPNAMVLPQSGLEELLAQRLSTVQHVEVNWNSRLSDLRTDPNQLVVTVEKLTETAKGYGVPDWVWVVDKTISVSADFLVAADGSKSHVRQCLGTEYEQIGPAEDFVVYECETKGSCDGEMQIVLGDKLTAVMWPLSANRCRWSFQLAADSGAMEFPEKDRSTFVIGETPSDHDPQHRLQRLIHERAPWFEKQLGETGWSTEVRFERRLARDFVRNRCCLAGDAAHQTSPVGMQSMNLGLREAASIASVLQRILKEGGSLELLEGYKNDYRAEWQRLLGLKGGLKPAAQADPWIKQQAARILPCLPASGDALAALLRQIGLEFA